jgi:acetoin utilization deacetylase AcuC-like enzyme
MTNIVCLLPDTASLHLCPAAGISQVLMLDLDVHQGDGSATIFAGVDPACHPHPWIHVMTRHALRGWKSQLSQ